MCCIRLIEVTVEFCDFEIVCKSLEDGEFEDAHGVGTVNDDVSLFVTKVCELCDMVIEWCDDIMLAGGAWRGSFSYLLLAAHFCNNIVTYIIQSCCFSYRADIFATEFYTVVLYWVV